MFRSYYYQSKGEGRKDMDYLHFGKEGGEKLVVLPGLSLKSVMGFAKAIALAYASLAKDFDIYLFDHVHEEPQGYTVEGMAEDTLAAFDERGIDRASIVGVSMGGMVAQEIALKAPERVNSLVLTSTAMKVEDKGLAVLEEWEAFARQKDIAGLMASFGKRVYTPSFYERHRDVIFALGAGATDLDYRNFLISVEAIKGFDVEDRVKGIACPAFVIGAGEDRILGSQASRNLAGALSCEFHIYEGYGHAVYDEAPDYLARVGSFLRRSR